MTYDPFLRISVFIANLSEQQYCWRVFEDIHSQEYVRFFDIHNCLFMRLHFSKVSISASLKSFLLTISIDAPESTTNYRSSGLRFDASKHQFSEGENNVALSCSFSVKNTFGQLPRCFAGTLLLSFCLLLRPILKFWSVGSALMRFTWANISERRILVSIFSVTCNSFREFYTLDRFLPSFVRSAVLGSLYNARRVFTPFES